MFVSESKLKRAQIIAKAVCILIIVIWLLDFIAVTAYVLMNDYTSDVKEYSRMASFICVIFFVLTFKRTCYFYGIETFEKFISLHIEDGLTVHQAAVFMKMSDESFVKYFGKLVSKGYIINLDIVNINGTDEIVPHLKIEPSFTEYTYIECSKCGLKNRVAKGSDAKCTFCKSNLN